MHTSYLMQNKSTDWTDQLVLTSEHAVKVLQDFLDKIDCLFKVLLYFFQDSFELIFNEWQVMYIPTAMITHIFNSNCREYDSFLNDATTQSICQ